MNPQTRQPDADDMRPEYDFSLGVRGKHYEAYKAGTNVVFLEPDLVDAFPDSASVNQALRLLVKLSRSKARSRSRPNTAYLDSSVKKKRRRSVRSSRRAPKAPITSCSSNV